MFKPIEIKENRAVENPTPVRLVYILSASHSGSTLLAMLLGAHTHLVTVGELKATNLGDINRYRCSCGSPIRNCEFWSQVRRCMIQNGYSFDITDSGTDYFRINNRYIRYLLRPLVRGPVLENIRDLALNLSPAWRQNLPKIQNQNFALIQTICRLANARIIVDSSKIGLRLKYLLQNPAINVKILRLIRDGRAVAMTYTDPAAFADSENPMLRGGGMGGDRNNEKISIDQAAWEWRRSNEEAHQILARVPSDRWMEVRYEHLCRNPKVTLSRIFRFIGVEPQNTTTTFRTKPMHVLGNGMRLDTDNEIKLDERWKNQMTPEQLARFDAIAGPLNQQYGYHQSITQENP
ncbi:MAG: hypothetical protein GX629_00160 [Phycisphaerae bacterium]|jgi:hypothetical protein|nr:hypothetical protein [Phycisphaerae bacterium]